MPEDPWVIHGVVHFAVNAFTDHESKKKETLLGNDDDDNGDGNECHKRNSEKNALMRE